MKKIQGLQAPHGATSSLLAITLVKREKFHWLPLAFKGMPSIGGLPLLKKEGFMGILQESIGTILGVPLRRGTFSPTLKGSLWTSSKGLDKGV